MGELTPPLFLQLGDLVAYEVLAFLHELLHPVGRGHVRSEEPLLRDMIRAERRGAVRGDRLVE